MGHQLGVAGDYDDPDPQVPAWCNPPGLCPGTLSIMDYRSDPAAGIDEFATSELLTDAASIRKLADPI